MAFYISPPGGNISLEKLTKYAVTRFNFLCKVYDTGGNRVQIFDILNDVDTVKDADCLIEDTVKDRVSHFILRLACCCNKEMAAFFVKAETLLFDFRFTCMTEEELCRLFKSVDNLRKSKCLRTPFSSEMPLYLTHFLKTLSQIKGENSKWRTVVKRYLNGEVSCFMVPFWTVLHLVAARQVSLYRGIAYVPVCKLRETVTSLFEELLHNGIKRATQVFHTEDKRIRILLKTIKVMFRERFSHLNPGSVLHYDLCHTKVDDIVHMFPPCMSNLHRSLRTNHRLKHHSRIQYSLFLKEAGMSVHEALMFWRKEYSKSPSNSNGCTHVWSKDEGRYTYNIRHLYGLEGSRINYRGHSCTILQESNHGPQDCGGCPFSHFDSAHLLQLLHTEGITYDADTEEVLHLAKEKQSSQACLLYFHMKMKLMESVRGTSQSVMASVRGTSQSVQQQYCYDNGSLQAQTRAQTYVKQGVDRKQQCPCMKLDDSVSCFDHDSLTCLCENSLCHCSVGHHRSNINCCKHLYSSNNAASVDAETEIKPAAKTLSTTCANSKIAEDFHFDPVTGDSKISSKHFEVGKISVPADSEGVSETNSYSHELCKIENVIKHQVSYQKTVEKQAHARNIPLRNLDTSCMEQGTHAEKNILFQKPVEYFESFRSYLCENN